MRVYTFPILLALACNGAPKESSAGKESQPPDTTFAVDEDMDGYDTTEDCNDANASMHPGAPELCDGLDNDCSGIIDDNPTDPPTWYSDADQDGYGDLNSPNRACTAPSGTVGDNTDCNDQDPQYHPGAQEICGDPTDYNCDGSSGDTDADADGYPACKDCDDSNLAIHPDAPEVCNNKDDNCDGSVDTDANDAPSWYADADADGYGDANVVTRSCSQPSGTVTDATDCNDQDDTVHPGALESCTDLTDLNCDGSVGYNDADGDGYPACQECNDADPASFPGATETCDGSDNDCDGVTDEGVGSVWYQDQDGDSYGDATATLVACSAPTGFVSDYSDCDDSSNLSYPGAPEVCTDKVDYNCDGSVGYSDGDGDGYAACEECDDTNAAVHPGATEVCNGLDDDCDGAADDASASGGSPWYADADGDGYGDASQVITACNAPVGYLADGSDCDDGDTRSHPGAAETCTDVVDYNCDGSVGFSDADGDGYAACQECDDTNAAIHPGASETCNGVDDDCDGTTDGSSAIGATAWYADADGDGYGDATSAILACDMPSGHVSDGTDCNDGSPLYHPGATETCTDVVDYNCDGSIGATDADNDGYAACQECDDSNPSVYPGARESCNTLDDDCDGTVDEGLTSLYYRDSDGDGYGSGSSSIAACSAPNNYVADASDCDDADPARNPGAAEVCDPVNKDENCNSLSDDSDSALVLSSRLNWYTDGDGDGYGAGSPRLSCDAPSGSVSSSTDCNDANNAIHPRAQELCDAANVDEDCNGSADDGDSNAVGQSTFYKDLDGDGYGDPSVSLQRCDQPGGYVSDDRDCDDSDAGTNPAQVEICETHAQDEDCDGLVNDADPSVSNQGTWYKDLDNDGYGNPNASSKACFQPGDAVADASDCNDADSTINPLALEVCDAANVDEDCNGLTDDADPGAVAATKSTWYADNDGDLYGNPSSSRNACDQPAGFVADKNDCNDNKSAINPAAQEVCDAANTDEDCDGRADDADSSAIGQSKWYLDQDGDTYGDRSQSQNTCDAPASYVADSTDCDDANPGANPGALEVCDASNVDEDCDRLADDADPSATGQTTWSADVDGDGYGNPSVQKSLCEQPLGYILDATDCNDASNAVNPAAQEICDNANTDEDCDGNADDADASVLASSRSAWYQDKDGDAYGNASVSRSACDLPAGYVADSTDCNDNRAAINPGATEVCDSSNTDEDCDTFADDNDPSATGKTSWYYDGDGDAYGLSTRSLSACDAPASYVAPGTDCNDGNAAINPGMSEICDGGDLVDTDENCNGTADDADSTVSAASFNTFYFDADGDSYGNASIPDYTCNTPVGYVSNRSDCNDSNAAINPGAQEICDSANVDEDCDSLADDKDSSVDPGTYSLWYRDADGDKYGTSSTTAYYCDQPSGYVANGTDCDDTTAARNPGNTEVCDAANLDEDCDSLADDNDPSATNKSTWYVDDDGDGYGSTTVKGQYCDKPSGGSAVSTDCDDTSSLAAPGNTEICEDHFNNDCGSVDTCHNVSLNYDTGAATTFTGVTKHSSGLATLGNSVAPGILGGADVNKDGYGDILIGDPGWDSVTTGDNKGAVYLLRGSASGVTDSPASPFASITGTTKNDTLGTGVALISDLDNDGYDEVLVGAPKADSTGTDMGIAYLFLGKKMGSTSVLTDAQLVITGAVSYDVLGMAVSDAGDLTNDGTNDFVVGGNASNTGGTLGTVAVVSGTLTSSKASYTSNSPSISATISGSTAGDRLGASVLSNVDMDGDGFNELLIESAKLGVIYVFEAPLSGSYTQTGASASFTSVAVSVVGNEALCNPCMVNAFDNNYDGYDDVLVGTDHYNTSGKTDDGAAFLVRGKATLPSGVLKTIATAQVNGYANTDGMGRGVGAGYVDGDEYSDILSGAPGFDGVASNAGAAALVYGPASGSYSLSTTLPAGTAAFVGSTASGTMGTALSVVGDVDGDLFDDYVIGAPGIRYGKAYLYYGTGE